jgi:hypothetical protein
MEIKLDAGRIQDESMCTSIQAKIFYLFKLEAKTSPIRLKSRFQEIKVSQQTG